MEIFRTMLLCTLYCEILRRSWKRIEAWILFYLFSWFLMFFEQCLCLAAVEVSVTIFLYIYIYRYIYFFLLLLLKAHITFYHSRLQYLFLLCCFHLSLCPLFLFPVRKVPKLNEQEDKFLQEVFVIIFLKCLKLGLVKI